MIVTGTLSCPATYDSDFGISWPSTGADMNATSACPGGIGMPMCSILFIVYLTS